MIRRGGPLARRFLPSVLSNIGNEGTLAACTNLDLSAFNQAGSSHEHPSAASFGAVRHISFFPSGNKDESSNEGDLTEQVDDANFAAAGVAASAPSEAPVVSPAADALSGTELEPSSILDLANAAEIAALASASEDIYAPTKLLLWILTNVHNATGLEWWQSIALTTFGIRAATFPIMLMQIKNTYKLSQARPEIERLLEHLKEEQARGNPNATAEYQQRVMAVWQKYDASPLKSMVTLFVQAPLFIGFFSSLRALAAAKVPSFVEGGALWFSDLSIADPTYMLPVIASATFLLTVEIGAADGMEGQPDKMKSRLKNVMRGVAVLVLPFTLKMPAGLFMYWISSNVFSLFQASLLKMPAFKKAFGIPDLRKVATVAAGSGATTGKPVPTFSQKPKKLK